MAALDESVLNNEVLKLYLNSFKIVTSKKLIYLFPMLPTEHRN